MAFEADTEAGRSALSKFLGTMELPPRLVIRLGERQQVIFRVAQSELAKVLARSVPQGVRFIGPLDAVELPTPDQWRPSPQSARSLDGLSQLTALEVSRIAKPQAKPVHPAVTTNPLLGFSLLGQSAAFRERAIAATPLLGNLCLSGQVTAWYAAPNTGKTLIALSLVIDAVKDGRIAGGNVFYINADDGSEGLATKMELLDDLGVHMLVPGFKGFVPTDLQPRLQLMAQRDEARGVFVLVDTTKKFASLMDKKDSTAFAAACRQVALGGGAVLNLAHTAKASNSDGTPRYAGTTDLVDDADAAYTIRAVDTSGLPGERMVEFKCIKQRGDNAQSAAYAYAAENGVGYAERLSSVREVDVSTLDEFKRVEARRADEEVVEIIATCISEGINTKMVLGKEAAARSGVSAREAYRLVQRYTGDDPAQHRWRFTVRERGAKVFELLPPCPR